MTPPYDFDFTPQPLGLDTVINLYWQHADDLSAARGAQFALLASGRRMRPRLDDIEAEISYLLVRDRRPARVVEIGAGHGWSTTWLLRALADNGAGRLHSYDRVDHARRKVPADLAAGRWTFHHDDVRNATDLDPPTIDHLLLDADTTASFARWYVPVLLDRLVPGSLVSVHDVHRGSWRRRPGQRRVLLHWLAERGIRTFTVARRTAAESYEEIAATRRALGLSEVPHRPGLNPMVFFVCR